MICKVMQSHAKPCKALQSHASPALSFKVMQSQAKIVNQIYPQSFNVMVPWTRRKMFKKGIYLDIGVTRWYYGFDESIGAPIKQTADLNSG